MPRPTNGHYMKPMEVAASFTVLDGMLGGAPPGVRATIARNAGGAATSKKTRVRSAPVLTPVKQAPAVANTAKTATQALLASKGMPTPIASVAYSQRESANPLARRLPLATRVALMSQVDGLNGMDGFLDFLKPVADAAKSIIPANTVVGKLLNGNVAGAASATANLLTAKPPTAPLLAPNSPFAPSPMSIFTPQNDTQKYLLYGAAGLAGLLVVMMIARR